jgi:hypothetical protein
MQLNWHFRVPNKLLDNLSQLGNIERGFGDTVFLPIIFKSSFYFEQKKMVENNETTNCLNCGRSDREAPLLEIRFRAQQNWICSQCLPVLIHKPQHLARKLPGIDPLSIQVE